MTPESSPGDPRTRSFSSPVAGRVKGLARRVGWLLRRGGGAEGERVEGQAHNAGDSTLSQGCVAPVHEQGEVSKDEGYGEDYGDFDCSSVYSQDSKVDTTKDVKGESTVQQCSRNTEGHALSPKENLENKGANASPSFAQDKTTADTSPARTQPSTPKTQTKIPETPPKTKPTSPKTASDHPSSSPAIYHFALLTQPASPPASPRRDPASVAF